MVSLQSCKDDLSDLEEKVDFNNKQNFTSLKELWDYCRDGANSLDKRVKALEKFMDELNNLDESGADPKSFVNAFNDLKDQVNALSTLPLDELDTRLTKLENQIEARIAQLDNMITSLIIQRAFGPAFGDFSLPIGVQSNMLFNWYGKKVGGPDQFPSADLSGVEGVDFDALCADPLTLDGSEYNEIELGKVYLTANPVGNSFVGTNLFVENSLGEQLPVVLEMNETPDYLLTFGTRAGKPNGFYEASVKINKDEQADLLATIDVTPDASALKSAAKAAVKNPSAGTAANLVKAVYDQINAKQIPAYALRYEWTAPIADEDVQVKWVYNKDTKQFERQIVTEDDDATATQAEGDDVTGGEDQAPAVKDYAVLSKYELAVVTARPLSFNALKEEGALTSKKLPTGNLANFLERLKNKALDKINVNTDVTVLNHKVTLGNVEFAADNNGDVTGSGTLTVDGKTIDFTTTASKVDDVIANVNAAIVDAVCKEINVDKDAQPADYAEVKLKIDTVLLEMNNQIAQIVDDIKVNVNDAFSSITGSNYFELANRAFNLYNRFANKVNQFLANPNAALQVAALYDTADDLGFLSQSESDPTICDANGSFKVYLTTYTGEIVAPAFKKFFACVNDPSVNTGDLGKVLDGSQKAVKVSGLKKGKYTFVYQALDYSGYTSTKKFYIEVK